MLLDRIQSSFQRQNKPVRSYNYFSLRCMILRHVSTSVNSSIGAYIKEEILIIVIRLPFALEPFALYIKDVQSNPSRTGLFVVLQENRRVGVAGYNRVASMVSKKTLVKVTRAFRGKCESAFDQTLGLDVGLPLMHGNAREKASLRAKDFQ